MIFAKLLKLGLDDTIDEEHLGFMPSRNISNNIWFSLGVIDYSKYTLTLIALFDFFSFTKLLT